MCIHLSDPILKFLLQSKGPEGFSSMVILKAIHPKTKELVVWPPFKLPPTHKHLAIAPTAVEARHFAATYALFRVCSMRNIHMMLPPNYRDLWKGDFDELKKDDLMNGKRWIYEADPFAAKQEREETQTLMAKQRDDREKQRAQHAEQPKGPGMSNVNGSNRNFGRAWTNVPKIDLGKRIRAQIEDLVRRYAVWNPHDIKLSDFQRRQIINELVDVGFRKAILKKP